MKKSRLTKLCIVLAVAVLCVGCIGSAFALYSINATTISIGIVPQLPDSYTLKITGGGTENTVELRRNTAAAEKEYFAEDVYIKTTDTFTVYKNDTALASGTDYSYDSESLLKGAKPTENFYFDFYYKVKTGVDELYIGSGHYLIGSMTDNWSLTSSKVVRLSTDPAIAGSDTAVLKNVAFTAGDEFKVISYNSDGKKWYNCNGGASQSVGFVSLPSGGNAKVEVSTSYNIYLSTDGNFYVGPADGQLIIDVRSLSSWFKNGNAGMWVYIWYSNGNNNGWPGDKATELKSFVYAVNYDTAKTISGVKVTRRSSDGGTEHNSTGDLSVPDSRIITITSM